jgi:XTP/dITP diphosphohydrolase
MKVVLASNNAGKIRELQAMLNDLQITVVPQAQLAVTDIAETGLTFIENALIKARHACHETGLPALADDSGLVVPALQGEPGIYSARYAGPDATSDKNIDKLLLSLKNITDMERHAFYYCALVYMRNANDPTPIICQASWHGEILTQRRGDQGFGYDPIFLVTTENKTAAELPSPLKNQLSHRGQALKLLLKELSSQ